MRKSEELSRKIWEHSAVVGVVGLGYVGLPLACAAAGAGFPVIGFDVQCEKVEKIRRGESYIDDVDARGMKQAVDDGRLTATCCFDELRRADIAVICVPTPLDPHCQPDLSYVRGSAQEISVRLHRDMLIILESTTYPGTTQELICPLLEKSGLKEGEDFYLAFSPERVDPGNSVYHTENTPKVVGGMERESTRLTSLFYRQILRGGVTTVSCPMAAEMEKLLENTYRHVNIALINELSMLCHRMGIDIWEVISAAATKPYGFQAFYPGPGLGGHCIPLDPFYLSWKAREYGFHTRLIETSGEINSEMPRYVVTRLADELNRQGKPLSQSRILLLGMSYKADIRDIRESPSLRIWELLEKSGARLSYYDPYVPSVTFASGKAESLPACTPEVLGQFDAALLCTGHSCLDGETICRCCPLVFDTRNAFAAVKSGHKMVL